MQDDSGPQDLKKRSMYTQIVKLPIKKIDKCPDRGYTFPSALRPLQEFARWESHRRYGLPNFGLENETMQTICYSCWIPKKIMREMNC